MSGEGAVIPACPEWPAAEGSGGGSAAPAAPQPLDDLLAYLWRRWSNARLVAGNAAAGPEARREARVAMRQCRILADDIAAGLHRGEAEALAQRGETIAWSDDAPDGGEGCSSGWED